MHKVEAKVKITNFITGKVEKHETIQSANPQTAATKFGQKYPDCGIQISWINPANKQACYITTQPINMKRDDELVSLDLMPMDEFIAKWYNTPDVEDFSEEDLEKEWEDEFSTKDEIDPWELDKPEEDEE